MNLSLIKQFLLNNDRINKLCAAFYRIAGRNKVRKRGNSIVYNNTYLSRSTINICGKNNQIIFNGTNYLKGCTFYIRGNHNRIVMGDKVCGYDAAFIIEDSGGVIEIGYKTLFAGKIEVACTEGATISIGSDCLFSSDIDIRNGDSHSVLDENGKRINQAQDIVIEDHVWVGHRAIVLKGSVIGSGCVIGAGAVVTKKFKNANQAIGGNPARVIKEDISWKHERL